MSESKKMVASRFNDGQVLPANPAYGYHIYWVLAGGITGAGGSGDISMDFVSDEDGTIESATLVVTPASSATMSPFCPLDFVTRKNTSITVLGNVNYTSIVIHICYARFYSEPTPPPWAGEKIEEMAPQKVDLVEWI